MKNFFLSYELQSDGISFVARKLTMLAYQGILYIENKNSLEKESLIGVVSIKDSFVSNNNDLQQYFLCPFCP